MAFTLRKSDDNSAVYEPQLTEQQLEAYPHILALLSDKSAPEVYSEVLTSIRRQGFTITATAQE